MGIASENSLSRIRLSHPYLSTDSLEDEFLHTLKTYQAHAILTKLHSSASNNQWKPQRRRSPGHLSLAENCSFVVQDEIRCFHGSNNITTVIHLFLNELHMNTRSNICVLIDYLLFWWLCISLYQSATPPSAYYIYSLFINLPSQSLKPSLPFYPFPTS